jgi:hypothetical protein
MLGVAPQDDTGAGEVVLVVEPARGGGYLYTCNGTVLDPQRVVSGVRPKLRAKDPEHTRMFVLFDHVISLDKMFEVVAFRRARRFEEHQVLRLLEEDRRDAGGEALMGSVEAVARRKAREKAMVTPDCLPGRHGVVGTLAKAMNDFSSLE